MNVLEAKALPLAELLAIRDDAIDYAEKAAEAARQAASKGH